ncbi:PREDICTED: acid sphingomyelinase-like phosphodiesterase 3b isoform X2 [Polistes canadensis]|uniref:acid sphingomyelinase-like phosphodiesterase 3b isoform X2 n=1 Tax=Polistes canadensis TaxID=91411 RepID=UPI000718B5FC|nr:PREDICTED: acid sphingomyelinase-like phosphodiesterase 3b isoform X2 [Polistes canadensis]
MRLKELSTVSKILRMSNIILEESSSGKSFMSLGFNHGKMIRDYLMLLSWFCAVQGKIGYFWHITDIHYDPKYGTQGNFGNGCRYTRNTIEGVPGFSVGSSRLDRKIGGGGGGGGQFGDYNCDTPWALIESAAQAMETKHDEGIEFVLWTGDALTRTALTDELRLQYLQNLTDLLSRTFKSQFVFPALGHEEIGVSFQQLSLLWQQWVPQEAMDTYLRAGYYTIEQSSEKYLIVFLNTNLWIDLSNNRNAQRTNGMNVDHLQDPFGQWVWFESVLKKARKEDKAVFIVGHTPPGEDDRESGAATLNERHNAKYLQVVRQNADIIRGQFFGHWHSDTFRVIYSDTGNPVSWIMIAPSITPSAPGGPNNPGLRLYKFETGTGQVLDYKQYYLDLMEANKQGSANWKVEYALLDYYDLKEITAISLHDLADRFTQSSDYAFVRYYAANTVHLPREVETIWGCGGPLNGACALHHYCTVTRLNADLYEQCYASYAFPLASRGISTTYCNLSIVNSLLLLLMFFVNLQQNR